MVQVNCMAPVVLTRRLLPAMRERGKGAIIITGSVAGRQPLPLHGLYAATKAFDQFLGESLWGELRGSGIDVLVLEPGPTATEFFEMAGETREAGEPPRGVVELALDTLGDQPSVVSGWFNYFRANLARVFPRSLTALVAERVVRENTPAARGSRARGWPRPERQVALFAVPLDRGGRGALVPACAIGSRSGQPCRSVAS
jgi:short-subunit dehydrogenase